LTISSEQLIAFVTVADEGSIAKAALILSKARSTIGESIANLELDLGFDLFDRSRRNLELTRQGRALLTQAKIAVMHIKRFGQLADTIMAEEESQFTITFDGHIPPQPLTQLAQELQQAFPYTQINLKKNFGEAVKNTLADINDAADLSFYLSDASDTYEGFSYKQVANMPLAYITRAKHPLEKQSCSIEQLSCYPQIFLGSNYSESFMETAIISPQWFYVSELDILEVMLKDSDSWSILPKLSVDPLLASGQFSQLSLEFLTESASLPIDMIWRDDAEMGAVKRHAINIATRTFSIL
jgi:DNA-binding transcriptional LysR family regulator